MTAYKIRSDIIRICQIASQNLDRNGHQIQMKDKEIERIKTNLQSSQKYSQQKIEDEQLHCLRPQLADILFQSSQYDFSPLQVWIDKTALIGKGGFSNVWNAFIYDQQHGKIQVVVKQLTMTKRQWQKQYLTTYEIEVAALALLSGCKQSVKLIASFYLPSSNNNDQCLFIVLQKCQGTVKSNMSSIQKSPILIHQVAQQLIQYLNFSHHLHRSQIQLQEQNHIFNNVVLSKLLTQEEKYLTIIHKDIKPSNILIRKLENQYVQIAVADLGMAMFSQSEEQSISEQFGGTMIYQSPEMSEKQSYDARVDCWSVGLVIYELFTKPLQLSEMSSKSRAKKYEKLCQNLQEELKFEGKERIIYLIRNCLQINPNQRLFSCQMKEIWQNFPLFLISQKVNTQEIHHLKVNICQLVVIQATLIQQYRSQTRRMKKIFLQKLCEANGQILLKIFELFPFLFKTLEISTISNLIGKISEKEMIKKASKPYNCINMNRNLQSLQKAIENSRIESLLCKFPRIIDFQERTNYRIDQLKQMLCSLVLKNT